MVRIYLLAAFIAGLLVSECCAQSKTFVSYPSKTILPIVFKGAEGVESHGSCTVIDKTIVLTAGHVVGGSTAEIKSTEIVRGKVIAIDLHSDRALVRLEKPIECTPRKLRTEPLKDGEPVWAFGYGRGFGHTLGRATAKGLLGRSTPGDSGGPILDQAGQVVGVVQGYSSTGDLYGHGRSTLVEWIQRNRDNDPIDLGGN
jgi:S1-C subfamily serine protease